MRILRLVPVCVIAVAAMLAPGALAVDAKKPGPPVNVRGFVLKPTEELTNVFSRTPAFTWQPVRGALCYEFELSTSQAFNESSIVWSNVRYGISNEKPCTPVTANDVDTTGASPADSTKKAAPTDASGTGAPGAASAAPATPGEGTVIEPLRVSAVSVDVALPWFTGKPFALYARARAITQEGETAWSKPFGFNMQWGSTPEQIAGANGLTAWTPVEGATGYQVMYRGPSFVKTFSTSSNVADQRDLWAFHEADPASWYTSVQWRVRAVRRVFGQIPNGLPAVSYGPWSQTFTAANPPTIAPGPITLQKAVSDAVSVRDVARSHQLMPGITWTGNVGLDGATHAFFRAYVATDVDCVNVVFKGGLVASPAYAPRSTGPLKLPASAEEMAEARSTLLEDGAEGDTRAADASKFQTTESSSAGAAPAPAGGSTGATQAVPAAKIDLPDVDFPSTRYYYTVVGADMYVDAKTRAVKYVDAELPQDTCAAGRVLSFGKKSRAVVAASPEPLVTGLAPDGTLYEGAAKSPVVYSTPLVSWLPAIGATAYEVQWSKSTYPWKAEGKRVTYATSVILDLGPGKWFYRIRGLNQAQLRKAEMTWSVPLPVTVAKPTFRLVSTSAEAGTTEKSGLAAALEDARQTVLRALPAIEAYHTDHGTFKTMTLAMLRKTYDKSLTDIAIKSATKSGYCVQSTKGRLVNFTGPSSGGTGLRLGACGTKGKIVPLEVPHGTGDAVTDLRAALVSMLAYKADHGSFTGMTVDKLRADYDAGLADIKLSTSADRACAQLGSYRLRTDELTPKPGNCA